MILSSTGIGLYMSNLCNLEIRQLKEFKKIIMLLKGEISFSNTALPDAIQAIARKENGVFKDFLLKLEKELFSLQGGRFQCIWENVATNTLDKTSICAKNRELITNLGRDLGNMDKHTQIGCLDAFLYELDEEIKEKTCASKDKIRLYNVAGVLFGIFVVIILV